MQYKLPLLYWPGYIHVKAEVAYWEQDFVHGGSKSNNIL
jgi:hypothetical protein